MVLHCTNLWVFGDSHNATKFISKLVGKAIILKYANCFHHFQDCLVVVVINGDAIALFSQRLLDYFLHTLQLASSGPFTATGIRGYPFNQNKETVGHCSRMKNQGSHRPEYK